MKIGFLYLIINIISTTLSQLILKWQVNEFNFKYETINNLLNFIMTPWVILSVFLFGIASISWVLTLSQFEITYIYPFSLISFVLIFIFGIIIFGEPITFNKTISIILILIGLYTLNKSN